MLENKVAETVGHFGMGLAKVPVTVGPCGAVDKVVHLGYVELKVEGEIAQGMATVFQAGQVEAGSKGIVADFDEEPDLAGCNMVPGPESHNLLVPVGHKIPSKEREYAMCLSQSTKQAESFTVRLKSQLIEQTYVIQNTYLK